MHINDLNMIADIGIVQHALSAMAAAWLEKPELSAPCNANWVVMTAFRI